MNTYTICFLVIIAFNAIKTRKGIQILQQNLYNEKNKYLKWISNNPKKVFLTLEILPIITLIIAYIINSKLEKILVIISTIFYLLEATRLLNNHKIDKVKIVPTKRVKRLVLTLTVLLILPIIIYLNDRDAGLIMLIVESIVTYFNYFILLIAKIINIPVEMASYKLRKTEAIEKMKTLNKLNVIGITGSYGKTSSKIILEDVLNAKYITKSTPKNLNTEKGLIVTVNKYLDDHDEVFISEMGSYKSGEVDKLCKIAKPKYGVLTSIDAININSFSNQEEIVKSQFELIESLPNDGVAVLNRDDIKQINYALKNNCKIIWIGIDNKEADINATNIKYSDKGTKFNVHFKKIDKSYDFETILIGKYNIYNILTGIALGLEFGMQIKELQHSIKTIKAIKGKMELNNLDYMYQINDMFNTSPIAVKEALDVLESMPGEKIVVTSGIENTNIKEKDFNHTFGNQIAKVADKVILIGTNSRKVFDGIMETGYDKDKLYVVNSIIDAYNLLKNMKSNKKIYALFEQDNKETYLEED